MTDKGGGTASQLCYCGYVFNGKRCRALQRKHPTLSVKNGWHKPVGEFSRKPEPKENA